MSSPNLPALIDTHCHLDFQSFDQDRHQVVADAVRAGITALIDPGIDLETSRKAVDLAQIYPQVFAAIGVHPNDADQWEASTGSEIEQLASNRKVVAIGEIGLDFYRDKVSRDVQIRVFEDQLGLAEKLNLPVIIHNREASADLMVILSAWIEGLRSRNSNLTPRPGVLHSFSADETVAEQATLLNFRIGITGPVTYPNAGNLQRLVQRTSLDHLLIETDAPFLSPQPQRGRRNEPGFVRYVAEKIAELQRIPFEEVAVRTTANAQMLFQIGEKSFA